jgi:D-aspartate ligase
VEQLRLTSPVGAVVIGGYVNGLGLVRGLAARGVPTAVVTTKPFDIAHRSRLIRAHDSAPDIEERPGQLVELLERRARDWRGWALIPTNDAALAALAAHHDRLSSLYRVAAPPEEVARTFLDKALMLEVARDVGLDAPHCYGPATASGVARQDVRFPVIVKPRVPYPFVSRFGCKLWVAGDRHELNRGISRLAEARIPGLVFDLVPGPDSRILAFCTYIDRHGDPAGSLTVRKLRQNPPLYGDARVAELAADDGALREGTVELLRRMGHRGIAIAEFKVDPRDGRARFIEVNGRSVVYNGLLRRGGLDVGALAWSDYVHGRPEPCRTNGWGGAWIHLHPDVLYSALYRRHRIRLADFLAPYRRATVEAVWSRADPAPFITQWSRTVRDGATALRRRSLQERVSDPTRL